MANFDVAGVISLIMRNELTTAFVWDWQMRSNVVETATGVMLVFIMQVKSSFHSFHFQGLLNPLLPHEILLQSSQSSGVFGVLTNLDERVPFVWSELFLAIMALGIFFNELYYFCLLNFYALVYQPYEVYFYADSFAMRFSPHELGFLDLHLSQTLHFLQQDCQKLSTFSLAVDPRWPLVSLAINAQKLLFPCWK